MTTLGWLIIYQIAVIAATMFLWYDTHSLWAFTFLLIGFRWLHTET